LRLEEVNLNKVPKKANHKDSRKRMERGDKSKDIRNETLKKIIEWIDNILEDYEEKGH